MTIAIIDELNDCSFAVRFEDKTKADIVRKAMIDGLDAWYAAAEETAESDVFTRAELDSFYNLGYAEPTMILLDKAGIEYAIEDVHYVMEDGYEVVDADIIIAY